MMGLMMMTFLFFFCFVVNVGMLVNAKINLQNAADLAAYAGAAVQARQLNTISYLNYEMRRQYKKFLFRYYVMGNMAQANFPTSTSGNSTTSSPYTWTPNLHPPAGATVANYQVPTVCVIFNSKDNFCQVGAQKSIPIPAGVSFDAISDALNYQTTQLETARQLSCLAIGNANLLILQLWLFQTSPNTPVSLSGDPDTKKMLTMVDGLTHGLGLIPRELLLKNRILTIKNAYLNQAPVVGVNLSAAQGYSNSADPHKYERTVQAFMTAYNTLGDHTFGGNLTMDELQSADQLEWVQTPGSLNKDAGITTNFDTFATFFLPTGVSPSATNISLGNQTLGSNPSQNDCQPVLVPQTLGGQLTVGFAKDPTIETYYAIRLQAQAQLLFNPWGGGNGLRLTAYSAAKPFGSRIGPNLTGDNFASAATPNSQFYTNQSSFNPGAHVGGGIINAVPWLPITAGDEGHSFADGSGWASSNALGGYLSAAFPSFTSGMNITPAEITSAYQVAMAPTTYESGRYNILTDYNYTKAFGGANYGFSQYVNGVMDKNETIYLWAPLVDPTNPGSLNNTLKNEITDMFPPNVSARSVTFLNQLITSLEAYISGLPGDTGGIETCAENSIASSLDDQECESINRVRLANPFTPRPSSGGVSSAPLPLPFIINNPNEILTSWNSPNDPGPGNLVGMTGSGTSNGSPSGGKPGRMGYSVKFVSFDSLINHPGAANNTSKLGSYSSPSGEGDNTIAFDLNRIQH